MPVLREGCDINSSQGIRDVLERHFALSSPAGADAGCSDEERDRYTRAVGLDPRDAGLPDGAMRATLDEAKRAGLDHAALFAAAQAYGRGLGRITAAEAEIFRRLLRRERPDARAAALDRLLSHTLPLSSALLQAIHRSRLRKELEDALADEALEETDAADRAIALVDLVSSTDFLARASPAETERMVDAIYAAGQESVTGRAVAPVKFVGDGFFLLGRDAQQVIAAALDGVRLLDDGTLPLRARAGLAIGPVVARAGDYFGLTVNVTQRLAQVAPPGAVLAERKRLPALPTSIASEDMTRELRGISGPTACVALRPGGGTEQEATGDPRSQRAPVLALGDD